MSHLPVVLQLGLVLAKLALISFGGGTATLGEMQRELVGAGWMTRQQFLQAYAIGQATPGPGVALVVPLGYAAAGVWGGIVALLAFFVPPALLALLVARIWARVRTSPWPAAFKAAMGPIAIGLSFGSAYTLVTSGLGDLRAVVLSVAALLLLLRTKLPTLLIIAGGAAIGALALAPR
jgi:chromate transporter